MFKAQFGNAKYSELAFAIPTRIDASGTYGVVEYKEENKEMIKDFLGYGRSRSSTESNVLSRHFNPYANCIHTQTGHCRENMEVLIAEFDMSEIKHIGQMLSSQNSRVIDPEGISYAVINGHKDGEPKIIERDTPMTGNYTEPRICTMVYDDYNSKFPQDQNIIGTITTQIGNPAPRNGFKIVEGVEAKVFKEGNYHKSGHNASSIVNSKGLSPTVMENHGTVTATIEPMSYRIRKLTPRECFRLMGVSETDIDKIQNASISNTQQYKLAGNSIVVDTLYHLFRKMFTETSCESQQLSLF